MKCLIWDFDGTLGFRHGMWSGTFLEVLDQELPGHGVKLGDIRPFIQSGFPWHTPDRPHSYIQTADEWWDHLLPILEQGFHRGAGLDSKVAHRLARMIRRTYLNPGRWQLYEDTLPALKSLSNKGWGHYILSNHVPELNAVVDGLGLAPLIRQVFTSAETGFEKPHPGAFHSVLAVIPSGHRAVMIGDNFSADVLGAKAVGMEAILVRKEHPDAGASCQSLSELVSLLQKF